MSTHGSFTLPLPDRFLPVAPLSRHEIRGHRAAANEIMTKALEQEIVFRQVRRGELDETKWKFVKAQDHLKVYKHVAPLSHTVVRSIPPSNAGGNSRRDERTKSKTIEMPSPSPPATVPSLMAIGKIEGRLEDVLYGIHHKTTDEMRITTSFINKHHLDAAVLHTIDSGTDADPFRYLGIKWRIAETPGGNLISNRDAVVLEFIGTSVDAQGHRFGFHVIKSIDVPWFPELPDPHIVRARLMLCCIYRQLEPAVVGCYAKGVFEIGGDLIDLIAYNVAADMLLAVGRSVDCAEAKKLTLRLIVEQSRRLKTLKQPTGARSRGLSTASNSAQTEESGRFGDDHICSVCHKTRSALSKIGSKWDRCRICCGAVCSKCHVRKTVLAHPEHLQVACCKSCILRAKELHVDPRDPYPVIGKIVSDSSGTSER